MIEVRFQAICKYGNQVSSVLTPLCLEVMELLVADMNLCRPVCCC
jgi:hypothetical protein